LTSANEAVAKETRIKEQLVIKLRFANSRASYYLSLLGASKAVFLDPELTKQTKLDRFKIARAIDRAVQNPSDDQRLREETLVGLQNFLVRVSGLLKKFLNFNRYVSMIHFIKYFCILKTICFHSKILIVF
jgi:hypothetical protein